MPETDSIEKNIARKIRELRGNTTQKDFGKLLGVSPQAVSDWENAVKMPRMGIIEKLSIRYNVPKSYILGEVDFGNLEIKPDAKISGISKETEEYIEQLPPEAIEELNRHVKLLAQAYLNKPK